MKVTFALAEGKDPCDAQAIWLCRLLPALKERGIEPSVLHFAVDAPSICHGLNQLRAAGIRCHVTRNRGTTNNLIRWYLDQLAREPPDVFVPQHVVWALYAARWVREAGIPTVCVLHSDDRPCRGLVERFGRPGDPFCVSAFVAVSGAIKKIVRKLNTEAHLEVIPCGVPIPPKTVRYRGGHLRICYIGRIVDEQKRISDVARAFCRCVREVPETEATIWGGGSQQDKVQQILSELGDGLTVTFGGPLDNASALRAMQTCHVVVLLSDYEGTPIVLLEGMANGLVPIVTRIGGGTEDLVTDRETGLIVANRGEDFLRAVNELHDPALWRQLSENARARVEKHYSSDVCAEQWSRFLYSLHRVSPNLPSIQIPRQFDLPPPHPWLNKERRVPVALDAPVGWLTSLRRIARERQW